MLAYLQAGTERTPTDVLARFIGTWQRVVLASNGGSGCSVAGVALDSAIEEGPLMELVRTILRSWVDMRKVIAAAGTATTEVTIFAAE